MWKLFYCICIFGLAFVTIVENKRIPKWHLKIAQKQGPNTCVVEEIPGTNTKYWTECKYWMNREICGMKTLLRYECCEGFQQIGRKGECLGVKALTDVLQTASDLGATTFVQYLKDAGLTGILTRPGDTITLFAPTNEAFKELSPNDQESLRISLLQPESRFLLNHAVKGRKLLTRDFEGEQTIESLSGGNSPLRINKYNHGLTTVNCAPIIRRDQQASNGVVHVISNVLVAPSDEGHGMSNTVPEALFRDSRFRELSRMLLESGNFLGELRRGGPMTLLAPTDEAFQTIPPKELDRIRSDQKARDALLKHHIIPHTVCLPAIIDEHKMRAMDGEKLELSCNRTGVYVGGAKFANEQILASNGVISVIDKVLVPDRAKSVMSLVGARGLQLSTFNRLMRKSNMGEFLDKPNITVTVFAPSNHAFEHLSKEDLTLLDKDQRKLDNLMRHHVVQGRVKTDTISDNQRSLSMDGTNDLRMKVYRKEVGVESAVVEEGDTEGQNGVLHVVSKVLVPPTENIVQLLHESPEYSMMADAIDRVKEWDPHFLNDEDGNRTFTVFAPSNEAFQRHLGQGGLQILMRNRKKLRKMVKNHVVDSLLSGDSIHDDLQYKIRTEYRTVRVRRSRDGNENALHVDNARVVTPDVLAKDGILHCIDGVLDHHQDKSRA